MEELIYFTFIQAQILISPFTKVEESFYLQSIHDFIYHDDFSAFDHHEFPGVVPRTAVPSILVSTAVRLIPSCIRNSKYYSLILTRSIIGLLVAISLGKIHRRIRLLFGKSVAIFFMIITLSQPHFIFYASRPLPNIIVMPLVLQCFLYYPLSNQISSFIQLSAFCILIFRSELALLFGSYLFYGMATREIGFFKLVTNGMIGLMVSLICSVPFDSFFWDYWLWPEGVVFKFNALEGRSAEWGVLPFFWYFQSALPRACLTSLVFIPFAFLEKSENSKNSNMERKILLPALAFILLYSFNGHKELRFIFYAIPILNIIAAIGMDYIYKIQINRVLFRYIPTLIIIGSLFVNFAATGLFSVISSNNYPGGNIMTHLNQHLDCSQYNVSLYISNLAAQTGNSRFLEECDNWKYDKTEDLKIEDILERDFSHIIVENVEMNVHGYTEKYRLVKTVHQYSKIKISPWPPQIAMKEALVLLERRDILEELAPKEKVYENNWIHNEL